MENAEGTGAIELLSSDDEGKGEGSDVENIAFEEYTGKDISTGEVLDQNLPTLGSTSNPLLDPASASHRNATQAVDQSNAPIKGFETASAILNQNRDQDVRSARKRSSSGDIDERNQPIIDSGTSNDKGGIIFQRGGNIFGKGGDFFSIIKCCTNLFLFPFSFSITY